MLNITRDLFFSMPLSASSHLFTPGLMSKSITGCELVQLMLSLHHSREEQRRKDKHILYSAKAGVQVFLGWFWFLGIDFQGKKGRRGTSALFSWQCMYVLATITLQKRCLKLGHAPYLNLKHVNVSSYHPSLCIISLSMHSEDVFKKKDFCLCL